MSREDLLFLIKKTPAIPRAWPSYHSVCVKLVSKPQRLNAYQKSTISWIDYSTVGPQLENLAWTMLTTKRKEEKREGNTRKCSGQYSDMNFDSTSRYVYGRAQE